MGKKKTPSRTVGDTPTPPITKRSLNPAIIDDNIAKLEKAIKAEEVTPNPSGTSEETLLTTIGIDGKKYDIGASAENVSYDNTDSGLTADDVQGAIDEITEIEEINLTSSSATLHGQHFVKNGIAYIQGYLAITDSISANSKIGDLSVSAGTIDTAVNYFGFIARSGNFTNITGYVSGTALYTQMSLQNGDEVLFNFAFNVY